MEDQIKERIRQIELEDDVVVCLAVESGSRAWGFPSTDSDVETLIRKETDPGKVMGTVSYMSPEHKRGRA